MTALNESFGTAQHYCSTELDSQREMEAEHIGTNRFRILT